MKLISLVLAVTICLNVSLSIASNDLNILYNFIKIFLLKNHAKFCVLLTCWNRQENINLSQILMKENIRSAIISMTNYIESFQEGGSYNGYVVMDYSCKMSHQVLQEAGKKNHLSVGQTWLILMEPEKDIGQHLEMQFADINLRMDSIVNVFVKEYTEKSGTLYSVYNPGFGRGGNAMIEEFGQYDYSTSTLEINNIVSKFDKRRNLEHVSISRVFVGTTKPDNVSATEFFHDTKSGKADVHNKFFYSICEDLQMMHRFNGNTMVHKKYFLTNDAVDGGMVKDIFDGSAQLCCAGILIRDTRINYFKFYPPLFHYRSSFIFRNLGHHKLLDNQFAKPFDTDLWFCSFGCGLLYIVILKFIFWLEYLFMGASADYTWITAILITVASFSQRGYTVESSNISGRIVYLSLLILSVILYNYYTSLIISALLNAKPEPITSLTQLRQTKMTFSMGPDLYLVKLLNETSDPRIFYEKVIPINRPPHYDDPHTGIKKVKKGGHGYHAQSIMVYDMIEKTFDIDEICSLEEVNVIGPTTISMIARRDSEYYSMFKTSLRMIETSGIKQRTTSKWVPRKPICLGNGLFESADIEELFIAFSAYAIGIMLALIILVIEIIWHYKKNRVGTHSERFLHFIH